MTEFFNPYQFVPVDTRRTPEVSFQDRDALKDSNTCVRHDYWHREGLSGRIVCTLETRSDCVLGARQDPGNAKTGQAGRVHPYLDENGWPAVPGSSLRGMIGSVLETISQSAMRVLSAEKDGAYSVRKRASPEHGEILTKVGLVRRLDNQCFVYPLSDNITPQSRGEYAPDSKGASKERGRFNDVISQTCCYQHVHENHCQEHQGIYFIRGAFEQMKKKRSETFFPTTGIDLDGSTVGMLKVENAAVTTLENILRLRYAMQRNDRREVVGEKLEPGQKQELKTLQLLPKGYASHQRDWQVGSDGHLLLHGDLVYYHSESTAEGERVVELSYSAIWRKQVPGDLHHAFGVHGGENALPWNPSRSALTPAEALLGVVEDRPEKTARNLASRVRVSDARSEQKIALGGEKMLKALSSPKPPSPAMYFGDANGYVNKSQLNLSGDHPHAPNGRKHYVPHARAMVDDTGSENQQGRALWETGDERERPHLKLRCTPIPRRKVFTFTVAYENLSPAELTLLLRALQPDGANGSFIHRLGLGKPLGLGHVEITDAHLEGIDRLGRYRVKALQDQQPRYQPMQTPSDESLINARALSQLLGIDQIRESSIQNVCYPFKLPQEPYNEKDGYQWFGENDRQGNQDPQALERSDDSAAMSPLKGN